MMNSRLYGRTLKEWGDFDHVLQAHNVKTPKDLNERLGKAAKAAPERRIKVYDNVNKDRLLGTMPVPSIPARGPVVQFPVWGPLSWSVNEVKSSVTTVTMTLDTRHDARSWMSEFVLVTSEPLSGLYRLLDFRLPGETEDQAEARQFCARN